MRFAALVLAALVLAPALPAQGEASLMERNLAALRRTLPLDSVLEVLVGDDGGLTRQLWTAEQYVAFRAAHATAMGRDYAAAFEGAPGGLGDQQYLGEIWTDHWGTTTYNVRIPRALPQSLLLDPKLTLQGGAGALTAIAETQALHCGDPFWCVYSTTYGWTYPQGGAVHDDAWFAFTGLLYVYPAPFGSTGMFNGVLFAADD